MENTAAPGRPRILVVDDEECLIRVVARLLHRLGFTAVVTTSARAALSMALEGDYTALISDIQMPELQGDELVAKLRARGVTIPIVLMSGAIEHTQYGPVLAKPFTLQELRSALAAVGVGS